MPNIVQPEYQTPEQMRSVEECLNLYSKDRKLQLEYIRLQQSRYDNYPDKDGVTAILDTAPLPTGKRRHSR